MPEKSCHLRPAKKRLLVAGVLVTAAVLHLGLLGDDVDTGSDTLHSPHPRCGSCKRIGTHKPKNISTSTCSANSGARGGSQKVFSYSFFEGSLNSSSTFDKYGRDYFSGLPANLNAIKTLFPGWIVRLYFRLNPDSGSWPKLCQLACEESQLDICDIEDIPLMGNVSSMYPLLWRFLPTLDADVDVVNVRDLDSLVGRREADAVDQFLDSDKDIHIMRDHPQHEVEMMGGMWGAKLGRRSVRKHFEKAFKEIYESELFESPASERAHDQAALTRYIWPWAKRIAISHDSYRCHKFSQTKPFPSRRESGVGNFVGSVISMNNSIPFQSDFECPLKCRPRENKNWIFC